MVVCRHSPRTHFGTPVHAGQLHIDNSTMYSKITAGSGSVCGDTPGLRYNELDTIWEFSNNGTDWIALGSGSGSAGFTPVKAVEYITTQINANTNHTLPNAETFKMAQGGWLDVLFNGQLLTHTLGVRDFDYEEVSTSQVKFHFDIPVSTVLIYIIRKRP